MNDTEEEPTDEFCYSTCDFNAQSKWKYGFMEILVLEF